jgi:carbon-monoxide dehydrogenase medium subunit
MRTIPIESFFVDLFKSALSEDEILIEIRIPTPAANSSGAYVKVERKVGDYAISAAAVHLTLDGDRCVDVRIGLTNVNPTPMRAHSAEQLLIGERLTEDAMEAAGAAAAAECDPSADLRGGVEYKRDLTRVLTKRAIRTAKARMG